MVPRAFGRMFVLTIGIDEYLDADTPNLRGATSDADSIVQLLSEKGVPKDRIRNLRNGQATRNAIKRELVNLITNPAIEENDPILIYFAGHGNEDPAPEEWANWDSRVQSLVPHDFNQPDGVGGCIHGIPDRALGTILHRLANAKGNNVTVILDCCHSGSGTRNTETIVRSAPPSKVPLPANIDDDLFSGEAFSLTRGARILPKFRHHGIESHILLAACKPEEVAHEYQGQGQFTGALLAALNSINVATVTYAELVRQLRKLPYQNPQCEGKVDRLLFSNDLQTMKGYYTAKLEVIKDKTAKAAKGEKAKEKTQLRVEAGKIHGITEGVFFDIWIGLAETSGKPLATCKATNVSALRTIVDWKGDLQPPQTLIAKPQKTTLPTLKVHISPDYKEIFTTLLDSPQAKDLPFCVEQTTRELADVALSAVNESVAFELVAAEEKERQCPPRVLKSPEDVLDLLRSLAFYYHHLRHDHAQPPNISITGSTESKKSFISMFAIEVYRLDNENFEPLGPNLNRAAIGVRISLEDEDDEEGIYGFKITNESTFDVYPHLFYFNSYDLSIKSFYTPVNVGNQKIDQPLKAGQPLNVGWGSSGHPPQSFGIDEKTEVENGFLKLYVTQEYVNLDFITQEAFEGGTRGAKSTPQVKKSTEFWGTITIPFVLDRRPDSEGEGGARGGEEDEWEADIPLICLLGIKGAKAYLLQDLADSGVIKRTDVLNGIKVHHLSLEDNSKLCLVDLPAFEDPSLENNVALCESLLRFFESHGSTTCNALLYAYDISKSRVEWGDVLTFGLVKDLCGDSFSKNIAILTTNWQRGGQSGNFEKREEELRDRSDYCKGLIDNGAQFHRCDTAGSTSTILSAMASIAPVPLSIQIDAGYGYHLTKTSMGATLRTRLHDRIGELRERIQEMTEELENASVGWDDPLPEDEVEAIKEDLRTAQDEARRLRDILFPLENALTTKN